VRHSTNWHEEGGNSMRPEDVIIAAFVHLRRIAAETTDMFFTTKGVPGIAHNDVNYDVVLKNCNGKLTQWMETWQREMQRAGGESFHFSFLSFFRLHVRLFLNSFGIQASMTPASQASPSLQALSACCTSALETLRIVSKEFASMSMLRYGQDSITVMVAYSAVFLLKLLRSSNTLAQLHEGTAHEIHALISKTAEAYFEASALSPASTSAAYHARFLRSLVSNDIFKSRRNDKDRYEGMPIDPRLQGSQNTVLSCSSPPQIYPQPMVQAHDQAFHFPASPHLPAHPTSHENDYSDPPIRNGSVNYQSYPSHVTPNVPHHASELDAHYWRNMFLELGFGENIDHNGASPAEDVRGMPPYNDNHHQPHHQAHQAPQNHQHQNQLSYHHMHTNAQPPYGH
jgi:hypothetical protein